MLRKYVYLALEAMAAMRQGVVSKSLIRCNLRERFRCLGGLRLRDQLQLVGEAKGMFCMNHEACPISDHTKIWRVASRKLYFM